MNKQQLDINKQILVLLNMLIESEASESIRKHGDYTKKVKEMQFKLKELKNNMEMMVDYNTIQ